MKKTAQGFVVPLTAAMVRQLQVQEGSEVELQPITLGTDARYASRQDALAAFERTLHQHAEACRALAK